MGTINIPQDKMEKCKCGSKVALGMSWINNVEFDQEPYVNGVVEDVRVEGNEINNIELKNPLSFTITICPNCEKIYSLDNDVEIETREKKEVQIDPKFQENYVQK